MQAARIQDKTGCRIMTECLNGLHQRGRGRLPLERVPYPPFPAIAALKDVEHLILVNAKAPVGFFAYPGLPSLHYPQSAQVLTSDEHRSGRRSGLARAGRCARLRPCLDEIRRTPRRAQGKPTSSGFGQMLAAIMPEDSIVVDEGISFGSPSMSRATTPRRMTG